MESRYTQSLRWIGAAIFMLIVFSSCEDKVVTTYTYKTQVPVMLQVNTFREAEIIIEPGKPLDSPGKIYIYGDYLFISEPDKGIHILDNSNPRSPSALNFINIPGTADLAINNHILYADNYVDLLAFDISNPKEIQLVKREEDVFPNLYSNAETGTIMTFKDTLITSTEPTMHMGWWGRPAFRTDMMAFGAQSASASAAQSYGQGGSMARFTLLNGHLYTVDDHKLRVFDVMNPVDPNYLKEISLGWGIETIFPYKNNLFIGSMTGMFIFDASSPANPSLMSSYQHVTACDPVVVNDTHAFVTLRSGVMCRFGVDELHILDITNLHVPKLLKAYPMDNPHGLGLSGEHLYIAEGKHGLKSFSVADVMSLKAVEHLKDLRSVDIIPGPKSLIVIGPDGVCQFDYQDPGKLSELSCISIGFQ
ncbi:LVIVD repeat-containing protein [Pleomorphovibrio marinus]|uniref:LVIVD repeat-containing protein n=1 Tax=Pleomorphovibrio marinus TaxID=2164132 RepID=UPI000E0C603F|nr:hypothetical protein [Pleomorphovibrio marinus]